MRVLFVLAILAMLSVADAETVQFGNYTAEFTWKPTHEVQVVNSSDGFGIMTFHGNILICMIPIGDPRTFLSDIDTVDSIMISGDEYSFGVEKYGKGYLFPM